MVESIFVERFLAIQLGRAPERIDEVFLDAPEVVFSLRVCEAENRARVCTPEDMRHAVSVAIDRDVARERRVCAGGVFARRSCLRFHNDTKESQQRRYSEGKPTSIRAIGVAHRADIVAAVAKVTRKKQKLRTENFYPCVSNRSEPEPGLKQL